MRFLVFDTETTGLPKTKFISPFRINLWPHIVQFSYIIYDSLSNDIIESKDYIVRLNENIVISEEAVKIHGITNKKTKNGVPINKIIKEFILQLKNVDMIIGHNINFDINMVKIELLRLINNITPQEQESPLEINYKYYLHYLINYKNISCTLKESIEFCNIQTIDAKWGNSYLKYPKLIELHEKLFNNSPNNLHNSFNDILITLRCYMKLKYDIDINETCESFKKYSKQLGI